MQQDLRVAALQLTSTADVEANLAKVAALVREAAAEGAQLVGLPENYGFIGDERQKLLHPQDLENGPFVAPLRELARELGVAILAGGVPERGPDADHVFNASVLIDSSGELAAVYRKIHLFDVEVDAETRHHESRTVAYGDRPVVAELAGWHVGLSVCYDLRFPELYRALVDLGAEVLTVPAAFTLQTGKDHWEPLLRARAIENQCYVVAPAQFGWHGGTRRSWGKAMIVDPWGTPLAVAPERESVVVATLSAAAQRDVRQRLPALTHRRLVT